MPGGAPMSASLSRLLADLPPATEGQWRALVEKTLKGEPFERLRTHTAEGLVIEPLYAPASGPSLLARPAPRDTAGRDWDLRTLVDHPDPAVANRQALEDLENGAQSLLLALDPSGRAGVAV